MDKIKEYVSNNNYSLFKTKLKNKLLAEFDTRGFYFSEVAEKFYKKIKNQPHLYVAFGNNSFYIGKSFQVGGRWKRSHYYHLGILAHEIIRTCKPKDQPLGHWIDAWMKRDSLTMGTMHNSIILKQDVRISFIPFNIYSDQDINIISKERIREINQTFEKQLIKSYKNDSINLLNIQNK